MAPVSTPPMKEARSIFNNLGYEVVDDGDEFRAKRKWREVRVTACADSTTAPKRGELRCFVAWEENAARLSQQLRESNPEYEWAVIAVREGGDYEVARVPPSKIAV
ncbi:hypothetical protein SAMN05421858_1821 [Haladaptatus litoreus]|uniref:Uncharacterized protein n=2 Tax=Haladaptatus TaxID=367188 RepID=A0A1N6Z1B0_9EURY|nr:MULTISPECIES: hypothetical protein [Haladaptatus]SIR20559.1 hypothetical protein SAMN05421858_1821 [Haladaptatus litoreus]